MESKPTPTSSDLSLDTQIELSHEVIRPSTFRSRTSVSQLPSLPDIPKAVEESHIADESQGTPDASFVEFDLSRGHNVSSDDIVLERTIGGRRHAESHTEAICETNEDDSETAENAHDDFFNDESNWRSMKQVSTFDYYNERGELEFAAHNRYDDSNDFKAYTKIDTEEQLIKYAKLDKKTDFLFQVHTEKDSEKAKYADDEEYSDYEDNLETEESVSDMKAMLTESQKFAYVGIVKLICVDMATDLARLLKNASFRLAKTLNLGQKNFANWTMYVMTKVYDHVDISADERKMIENLSVHGLEVDDLVKSLVDYKPPQNTQFGAEFDMRWVIVCDLFLVLLSDGYYDSRSRALFVRFAEHLLIPKLEVLQFERRLIASLELDTSNKTIENKDELLNDKLFINKRIKQNNKRRMAFIGLATIGGSLAIGLSAGLLAPVIGGGLAAGLTTVGISGTSGFLAGYGGAAVITTGGILTGAKVGSKAGARRVGDVHTFEFKPLHNTKRTNLIVTVSGWMNGKMDDVRLPFSTVDPVMGDMFSLLWEPEMLTSMGQTIGILASEALSTSIQQILGATILSSLMAAIQLPMALSKLSYLLDNPWNVSLDRAWKAGKLLADTLISGNLGVRPITLVGFSLGSRLIYSCLIELAKRGGYGLIENVILLGNPIAVKSDQITLARSVVSGKFINGYSRKDWVLGYLFRATGGGILTVAGLSPIEGVYGVENIDVTEYVQGHMQYRTAVPKILKALDWEVLSEEFAEIEEPDPEQGERTRKLISEFDEAKTKMMKEKENENKKTWKSWFRPKQKEWWDYANKDEADKPQQPEEYDESPIFDVNALMQEVNDIQVLGNEDPEKLEEVRQNVDTEHKTMKMNEETEEVAPKTIVSGIGEKLHNLANK